MYTNEKEKMSVHIRVRVCVERYIMYICKYDGVESPLAVCVCKKSMHKFITMHNKIVMNACKYICTCGVCIQMFIYVKSTLSVCACTMLMRAYMDTNKRVSVCTYVCV